MFVGANFWNINWQKPGEYFRPGTNFSTTTNPWRPDLLKELQPYRVLRFMDWNDTNHAQTSQAHFNTRKPKSGHQNLPVALEWQIDLCNRMQADCWLNLHHTSSPEDWRQVAELVKKSLDPSLRLYVEWSNEVWNRRFPQRKYAEDTAAQLNLPGENRAAAHYVYASVRLFEEFERSFAGQEQRLVKVLAGQAAWTGPCEAHIGALSDKRINPRQTRPDVYAIAPYFRGKTVDELRAAIPKMRDWAAAQLKCTQQMGVPLISYEGGSDSFGRACVVMQHDPAMRELYVSFMDALVEGGMRGPFMQYTHSGRCWGLKEKTGDPPNISPKYQGLMDWLAKPGRP